MASTIYDDHIPLDDDGEEVTQAPVCLLYHRKQHDHRASFLQCLLMGIYYDNSQEKRGVPELIENNIGTNYKTYKEDKGFEHSIVYYNQYGCEKNAQIPPLPDQGPKTLPEADVGTVPPGVQ